jgi:hypothetical protein
MPNFRVSRRARNVDDIPHTPVLTQEHVATWSRIYLHMRPEDWTFLSAIYGIDVLAYYERTYPGAYEIEELPLP